MMNSDGTIDMVDVHGYVHKVSANVHKDALGLAWCLFLGAILINLLFYKLHPAMPEMSPTSDEKLQTHVCGTVWNIKKCSCGTSNNEVVEDNENIEIVVDTTGNDTEEEGVRNLESFELQDL